MMPRRHLLTTLGLAASLGLVACSGSAASTAPTSAPTDAPTTVAPDTAAPASPSPVSEPPVAAGPCTTTTDSATVEVVIEGFAFSPSTVQAAVGDVIGFTNRDAAPHTATLTDGTCTTASLGADETDALVFSEAGTYPFICRIHPDMRGTFEIAG